MLVQTYCTASLVESLIKSACSGCLAGPQKISGFSFGPFFRHLISLEPTDSSGKRALLRVIDELGIRWLDFDATVRDQNDPMALFPLRVLGHFGPEGYALLAREIVSHFNASTRQVGE